jgi:cellulose synthase/poly-beta-1,6-N-acetylglucosamine synthase-like glycosyltransferase
MKASIIIPAYNAEKTIAQCLESMGRQFFSGYETIVVDDGSSDLTAQIVSRFKNVKLVRQKNSGPAVARNNGASQAKGEIVVFTDSDCIADRQWLARMLKPFEDKAIAGVQGRYKSRQRKIIARLIQLEIEKSYAKMKRQESIDFIGTYSAAYRKSLFKEMQGFDTSFPIASGEDTDLSFRIEGKGGKLVFSPKAIVFHRHPASLGKYLKIKFSRAFWRTKVYKRHKGKMLKDAYTSQTVKAQTALFYALIPAAGLALISPGLALLPLSLLGLLFLSTVPFAAWAFQKDKAPAIVSPFTSILRTAAFGLGLAAGTIREIGGK